MDIDDLNTARLYKMINVVCRNLLWEILIHCDDLHALVQNILKDVKIPKHIITSLEPLQNTSTYVEGDFDVTSLTFIITRFWRKFESKQFVDNIRGSVEFIKGARNRLAHREATHLDYDKEYLELRGHIDLLEDVLFQIQQKNASVSWKRRSRRFLNLVDRIDKERIDPETLKNIIRDIKRYMTEMQSKEDVEYSNQCETTQKTPENDVKVLVERAEQPTIEVVKGYKDTYDRSALAEILTEVDDKLVFAEENNQDQQLVRNKKEKEIGNLRKLVQEKDETNEKITKKLEDMGKKLEECKVKETEKLNRTQKFASHDSRSGFRETSEVARQNSKEGINRFGVNDQNTMPTDEAQRIPKIRSSLSETTPFKQRRSDNILHVGDSSEPYESTTNRRKTFDSSEMVKTENNSSTESPDRLSVRDTVFNFEKRGTVKSSQTKLETSRKVDPLRQSFSNIGQGTGGQDADVTNVPVMHKRTQSISSANAESSGNHFSGDEPGQSRSLYDPQKSRSLKLASNFHTSQMLDRKESGTPRVDMRLPKPDSDNEANFAGQRGGCENLNVQSDTSDNQSHGNSSMGANTKNYRKQSGEMVKSLQRSFSDQTSFKNDIQQDLSQNNQVLNEKLTENPSEYHSNKHSCSKNIGYFDKSPSTHSSQTYNTNVSANINNTKLNDVCKESEVSLVSHTKQRSKEKLECDELAIKDEDAFNSDITSENNDTSRSPESSSICEHTNISAERNERSNNSVEINDKVKSKKENDDLNEKIGSTSPVEFGTEKDSYMRSEKKNTEIVDTLGRTKNDRELKDIHHNRKEKGKSGTFISYIKGKKDSKLSENKSQKSKKTTSERRDNHQGWNDEENRLKESNDKKDDNVVFVKKYLNSSFFV